MSFRRRSYPEVLENLLTALSGGVAAETQPFPPEGATAAPFRLPLEQTQVRQVVSVHGTRNGQSHRFRSNTDYLLDGSVLVWPEGAELPDAGTVVHVNYLSSPRPGPVTDIHTGSVVRTLAESIALELAGVYAQLESVYDSSFIDTAQGRSLDQVVALLGLERVRGGRATTQVEFTRAAGTRGAVTIPAGTRVLDEAGEVEYETTEAALLAPEQKVVRVRARDLEQNDPVAADTLIVLPVPIAGIGRVTNPAPAVIGTRDESDDELRTRARGFLHGSERATLGALRQAITRQGGGITADVEEDPAVPGLVRVSPHADTLPPALAQRLQQAIDDVRPVGVRVELQGQVPPRRIDLEVRLVTSTTLLEPALRAAHDAVRTRLADYFAKLPTRAPGSINRLVGLALGVSGVEDVRILSASLDDGTDVLDRETDALRIEDLPTVLGSLSVADSNLASSVIAAVTYPAGEAPPDANAIRQQLEQALAYLNAGNASEPAAVGTPAGAVDRAKRDVAYGKLLLVTPLPVRAAGDLQAFDAAVAAGSPPELPSAAGVLPYRVSYVVTQASGLTSRLTQPDQSYQLTPFERLALASVEVAAENGNG